MLTRTAIYEGHVKPGEEERFFRLVREKLEPVWQQFPHVLTVRVQRIRSADDGAAPIAMILEMDYADQASLDASLASDIKEHAHAATLEVMELFEGRFYHLIADPDSFGPASEEGHPEQMATGG